MEDDESESADANVEQFCELRKRCDSGENDVFEKRHSSGVNRESCACCGSIMQREAALAERRPWRFDGER